MSTEPTSAVRATSRPTRFSLAANYDPELVPALAAYPVDEVYGKFPTDGFSGGRPRYLATPLSEADLRNYIRLLDRQGIAFNHLLNGACFGNREWTHPWQKRASVAARCSHSGPSCGTTAASPPGISRRLPRRTVKDRQPLGGGSGFTTPTG